ncbi:MAG: alpha/beta hydrolase [Pseudomonadota bacterium]
MHHAPDGTRYALTGPQEASAVVLVHGLGLNQASWQWTVPALQHDYRVLTYDLFGHGQSARPPQAPALSVFSNQLAGLLDHCEIESAVVAGFSLGGMIARRFAQDAPQRTRALMILHSPHRRSTAAQAAVLKRVALAHAHGPDATVEEALERWFTDAFRAAEPELMDQVRGWVKANDPAVYDSIYRVLADGVDEVIAPDPPITCPALVITGDEDFGNGPEMARAIADEITGAQLRILPGLRHMALAENPAAFNTVLRAFLADLERGA